MTVALIANIVFAAFVLVAIPGMLAWAIRASRNDVERPVRARRPVARPSASRQAAPQRRPAPRTGPARPTAS